MTALNVGIRGLVVAVCAACSQHSARQAERVHVTAGPVVVDAEIVRSHDELRKGMTGHPELKDGAGMVFVLPYAGHHCFWMKDTAAPLSIAFMDARGQVLNVADMEPYSERKHCAAGQAQYALEVNRGYLSRAGIHAGMVVGGLPSGW